MAPLYTKGFELKTQRHYLTSDDNNVQFRGWQHCAKCESASLAHSRTGSSESHTPWRSQSTADACCRLTAKTVVPIKAGSTPEVHVHAAQRPSQHDTTRHTDQPFSLRVTRTSDPYSKRQFLVGVESKCSSSSAQKPAIGPHLRHATPSQPASRRCDKVVQA